MASRLIPLYSLLVVGAIFGQSVPAQTIPIHPLEKEPTMDGNGKDWDSISATNVALKSLGSDSAISTKDVSVKGGTHGHRVYFFLEWKDATENNSHKPWVWNDQEKKYVLGTDREDRLAIQFSMDENYSTNWASGKEFSADTWHWKAYRSNPLGLAHDKSFLVSRNKLMRAYRIDLPNGEQVYISRPSDSGDKLYKTKRYRSYKKQIMPKYIPVESPKGSVADIKATGVWKDGVWRLELSRKLETGNADDVAFPKNQGKVLGGIAVFDQSENDDHVISDTLTFDFR